MLIEPEYLESLRDTLHVPLKGVIHIGAHECEELPTYIRLGIPPDRIVWLEALEEKVHECKERGITEVHQAVISDCDAAAVVFRKTNNVQSSSLLPLGTHAEYYPHIVVAEERPLQTITLPQFFQQRVPHLNPADYNIWNLDIQGAELLALRGAAEFLQYADILYLEVNEEEVHKGCATVDAVDAFLEGHGFRRIYTVFTAEKWGDAVYMRNSRLTEAARSSQQEPEPDDIPTSLQS